MTGSSFFLDETCFVPYVSFVICRPRFTRWKVKERTIEDHELVLITDGEGILRIGDETHPLSKGTLLYLHYDQWHSMAARRGRTISFYSVHFSWILATHTRESWSYHTDINYYLKNERETGENWRVSAEPGLLPFPHTMTVRNYDRIEEIYVRLEKTFHETDIGYGMELNILCQQLVQALCHEQRSLADRANGGVKRLDCAVEFIRRHYARKIRVQELCACVNLNESNTIKLFKRRLGCTPVEYINQVRVNRAKELLLRSDLCVKEIAWQTGFTDAFYFSRVFKKMEGRSPRSFKQEMLS